MATMQEAVAPFSAQKSTSDEPKMQYVRLGRSGLKISKVVLGAMSFGKPERNTNGGWVQPPSEALPILKHAYDRGINTWDTANYYGLGSSEEIIAQAIKEYGMKREKLVLMTKLFFGVSEETLVDGKVDLTMAMVNDGPMVNRVGLSRKNIMEAVDASVKRYITTSLTPDRYQLTQQQLGHLHRRAANPPSRPRHAPRRNHARPQRRDRVRQSALHRRELRASPHLPPIDFPD